VALEALSRRCGVALDDSSTAAPNAFPGRAGAEERAVIEAPRASLSPILRLAALTLLAALALIAAPAANASVSSLSASLDGGGFSEFSQTNALRGTLGLTSSRVYSGAYAARAAYEGGGENGYERGIWNVQWEEGDDVWFGAAYYLPTGFLANVQGQVDLVRWDNWSTNPTDTDWGGVSIYGSDHHARLLRFGAGRPNDTLVGPFDLPEGRWFTLEVHQHRSATAGSALSEVYLDGKLIGRSTAANTYGRAATRIRYGIVAIAAGSQVKPLELYFDSASMGTASAFAAGSPEPAPEPTPEPSPEPAPEPESSPTGGGTESGGEETTTKKPKGHGRRTERSLARASVSPGKRRAHRSCGGHRRRGAAARRSCRR
jgi:hypothetical protein